MHAQAEVERLKGEIEALIQRLQAGDDAHEASKTIDRS